MTKTPNESIPFADIDDHDEEIEGLQSMVERIINGAFGAKQMDELTYRRLSIEAREIVGDPYDHLTRILKEAHESVEIALLDRLVIGDEFIDSLSPDDPRYTVAVSKYERLHEQYRTMKARSESA
jgi:hypothetical protein